MNSKKIEDGGYYAIKGFTFQFDKSLLEIIANPRQNIEIEQIQDIAINKYYIQIKYKESQTYAPSKIKTAVTQLFQYFLSERTSKFTLYCYFKDKLPVKKSLTLDELDEIFGKDKSLFIKKDKEIFIKNFTLEFAENFDSQFKKLIKNIKNSFELKSEEESMIYHAIFRASLLEIATKKDSKQRTINIAKLKNLINKNEKIILELAHCNYLKNKRYLTYLKKEYFTFKKVNIPHRERLFVIEIDNAMRDSDILQIIFNIQNRYFKKDTSPAPYICLTGISSERMTQIKQKLWDKELKFTDGTHFNGDKFRIKDLLDAYHRKHSEVTFKLIAFEQINIFLTNQKIEETFLFLTPGTGNNNWRPKTDHFKEFYIKYSKDILQVIQ